MREAWRELMFADEDLERKNHRDPVAAAGQTVFHLHVHVIPRFQGDVGDPRGGVRHVISKKANYLGTSTVTPEMCIRDRA